MDILQQQHMLRVDYAKRFCYLINLLLVFFSDTSTGSPYTTVDLYSAYPTTAYGYPTTAGAPPSSDNQAVYPSSTNSYPYDSRRPASPPSAHFVTYDYTSGLLGNSKEIVYSYLFSRLICRHILIKCCIFSL